MGWSPRLKILDPLLLAHAHPTYVQSSELRSTIPCILTSHCHLCPPHRQETLFVSVRLLAGVYFCWPFHQVVKNPLPWENLKHCCCCGSTAMMNFDSNHLITTEKMPRPDPDWMFPGQTFWRTKRTQQSGNKRLAWITWQQLFPAFDQSLGKSNHLVVRGGLSKVVHRHTNASFLQEQKLNDSVVGNVIVPVQSWNMHHQTSEWSKNIPAALRESWAASWGSWECPTPARDPARKRWRK